MAVRPFNKRNLRDAAEAEDAMPPDDGGGVDPDPPFVPLGFRQGRFYFIAAKGEVRDYGLRDLTWHGLVELCGSDTSWLIQVAQARDKENNLVQDFNIKKAGRKVMALCFAAGIWDPLTPLRDAGIWPVERGQALLAHYGDIVEEWRGGALKERHPAGFKREGAVYVLTAAALRRSSTPAPAETGKQLVAHIGKWAWRHASAADAIAGLTGLCMLGAGPDWRMHGAINADPESGKSQFLKFIGQVLGPLGFYSNEFTEASIRQALMGRAATLLLDETEVEDGPQPGHAAFAVKLIRRLSGDGGLEGHRGSASGKVQVFNLVGTAFIGGVNLPPMGPADRSRFLLLDLLGGVKRADIAAARRWAAEAGDGLRARMLSLWPKFGPARDLIAAVLEEERALTGRVADAFANLGAARWLLTNDVVPTPEQAGQVLQRLGLLIEEHVADLEEKDGDLCANRLFTSSAGYWRRGEDLTVGELVRRAAAAGMKSDQALALPMHGLRLLLDPPGPEPKPRVTGWLAVANQHQALARIFAGSRWQGGGWRASLMKLPGSQLHAGLRFSGPKQRCVLLWLDALDLDLPPPPVVGDDMPDTT